jgi:hypothetical protein
MRKYALCIVALSGLLAACGGSSSGGASASASTQLLDDCAVCQRENPDSYYGCVRVCTAAGLWGAGSDDVKGRN